MADENCLAMAAICCTSGTTLVIPLIGSWRMDGFSVFFSAVHGLNRGCLLVHMIDRLCVSYLVVIPLQSLVFIYTSFVCNNACTSPTNIHIIRICMD